MTQSNRTATNETRTVSCPQPQRPGAACPELSSLLLPAAPSARKTVRLPSHHQYHCGFPAVIGFLSLLAVCSCQCAERVFSGTLPHSKTNLPLQQIATDIFQ